MRLPDESARINWVGDDVLRGLLRVDSGEMVELVWLEEGGVSGFSIFGVSVGDDDNRGSTL